MSIDRLLKAPIEVIGRFADASNATLLVRLTDRDGRSLERIAREVGRDLELEDFSGDELAVYKPIRGEAPLRDFPEGTLHRREVAAYEISAALGWDLVPHTVLRPDGPYGEGSLQAYVVHDPALHYFNLLETAAPHVIDQLRRMVVFDLVIDNADRKAGHVLLTGEQYVPEHQGGWVRPRPQPPFDELVMPPPSVEPGYEIDGTIQLVDHGVSFNVDRKIRTVAWEFQGEPLSDMIVQDLGQLSSRLSGGLGERLANLLTDEEIQVLAERLEQLRRLEVLPGPIGQRPYPWPPI